MRKTKVLRNVLMLSAIMSASVLGISTALAAEDTPEYFLDTLVVTATRTEKSWLILLPMLLLLPRRRLRREVIPAPLS